MTAFESTAPFYSRYRVPYPDSLLAQLKLDANLGPVSTVLDLASGPGRFGLALASSVHEVIAVDVEPEMLEEGERVARRLGIGNVRWILGRVEEVAIEAGSIDLVTIGEAFHRLEQGVVLRRIRQWLKAGGCVAIGGCFGVQFGDEQWQASLRRAIEEWEGAAAPSPGNAAALSRGIPRHGAAHRSRIQGCGEPPVLRLAHLDARQHPGSPSLDVSVLAIGVGRGVGGLPECRAWCASDGRVDPVSAGRLVRLQRRVEGLRDRRAVARGKFRMTPHSAASGPKHTDGMPSDHAAALRGRSSTKSSGTAPVRLRRQG